MNAKTKEQLMPLVAQKLEAFERCFGERPSDTILKQVCDKLIFDRQRDWLTNNLTNDFHTLDIARVPSVASEIYVSKKAKKAPKQVKDETTHHRPVTL